MTTPPVIAPDPLAGFAPVVRWVVERATPEEAELSRLDPRMSAEQVYEMWRSREHFAATIRLIAAVLPSRESIWWAWVSARYAAQLAGAKPATAEVHNALTAVERWIVRPDEDARMAVWEAGQAAGLDTPTGLVCGAVFLSGATVAAPPAPVIPAPPGSALPLIGGAIILAASWSQQAEQLAPTMIAFAAQGMEIVKRLGGWDAAAKSAYETHQRLVQEYARLTAPAPVPAAR